MPPGRMFFAEESETLGEFYREIGREVQAPAHYHVQPTVSDSYGQIDVLATAKRIPPVAAPQIEFILDASGSMRERKNLINGRLKIDIAEDVMKQVIGAIPEGTQVAFRVYRHRIAEGRTGDCFCLMPASAASPAARLRLPLASAHCGGSRPKAATS